MQKLMKIGRNDVCPCGSGLKYKKCCLLSKPIPVIEAYEEEATNWADPYLPSLKMSEIILEFAEDILELAKTTKEKKTIIEMACFAWNLAFLKEINEGEYELQLTHLFDDSHIPNHKKRTYLYDIISTLVERKIQDYPFINRFIIDYQLRGSGKNISLSVASTFSPTEEEDILEYFD
jgi:hypothetical protein